MKNLSKITLLFLFILSGLELNGQTQNIDEWELPRTARNFIAHSFSTQKIADAYRKEENGEKEFKTILDNGVKIEFDHLGFWTEIQSSSGLPTEFIPKKIIDYLNETQKGYTIIKIEKELHTYELELADGKEFEFSLKGKFLKRND